MANNNQSASDGVFKENPMQLVKPDLAKIVILFVLSIFILWLLFYKEGFYIIVRSVFSFFWLFVLPGFSLMYYWQDQVDFIGRLFFGCCLSLGIVGIGSYYLGFANLNLKISSFLIPVVCIVAGIFALAKFKAHKQ